MRHWKLLTAALIAAPVLAQPAPETTDKVVEESVEEKVTIDDDGQRHVERTVVRKIETDGEEFEGIDQIERDRAEKMVSDCPGRIFATKVEMTNAAGQKQSREIKLCGESDDPQKWVDLLESAKEQVIKMDAMDAAAKASLLDDLDAEIARTKEESDAG